MTSDEYIAGLGEHFIALRPKGLVLNSLDYMVLKRWESDQIPYAIAYNTLTEVLERLQKIQETQKVRYPCRFQRTIPLSYLDMAVRNSWREVLALQTPEIRHGL